MDELTIDEARITDLRHWLNSQSRCFGDKGDVEDITEGGINLPWSARVVGARGLMLHHSRYHLDR